MCCGQAAKQAVDCQLCTSLFSHCNPSRQEYGHLLTLSMNIQHICLKVRPAMPKDVDVSSKMCEV